MKVPRIQERPNTFCALYVLGVVGYFCASAGCLAAMVYFKSVFAVVFAANFYFISSLAMWSIPFLSAYCGSVSFREHGSKSSGSKFATVVLSVLVPAFYFVGGVAITYGVWRFVYSR